MKLRTSCTAAAYTTPGMRICFMSIPLTLWLFGPLWLLAGTLLLIAARYRIDRGV